MRRPQTRPGPPTGESGPTGAGRPIWIALWRSECPGIPPARGAGTGTPAACGGRPGGRPAGYTAGRSAGRGRGSSTAPPPITVRGDLLAGGQFVFQIAERITFAIFGRAER